MLDEQTLCNQWRTQFLVYLWDGFGPDKKLSVLNQNVFPFDSQKQAYNLDICGLQACSRWFSHSFFFVDRHCEKFSDMWFSKNTDSHLSFDSKRFACLTWFWWQCLSVSDRNTKLLAVSLFGTFTTVLQVRLIPDIFFLLTECVTDCSHWWSMQLLTVKGSAYNHQ